MRRVYFILLILFSFSVTACAMGRLKGLVQTEISAVKQEFEGEVTGIKGKLTGVQGDLALVKGNVDSLLKASAQIGDQTSIGGNQNISNDTALMKYMINTYRGIILAMLALLSWIIKFSMKQNAKLQNLGQNKDFYMMQLALKSKPEDWQSVMELKGKVKKSQQLIVKQNSLLNKTLRILKNPLCKEKE